MKKLAILTLAFCLGVSGMAMAIEDNYNDVNWHQLKVMWNTLTASEQAAYMDLYNEYMETTNGGNITVTALGVDLKGAIRTPGDTCGDTTLEVSALPYADSGDNTALVNDYDIDTNVTCNTTFNSTGTEVVYQVQVDQTCDLTVAESQGAYDVVLWAVTDCADVDNTCVASSDGGNPEAFTFTATAGVDYWIMVDGWNGQNGAYTLDVTEATATGCMLVPVELQSFQAE